MSNDAGRGQCECDALSPVMINTRHRRQWHKAHKADIHSGGMGVVRYRARSSPDDLVAYLRSIWPERPAKDPSGRGPTPQNIAERFFRFVDADGPCWLWTGGLNPKGYGTFYIRRGSKSKAHRVSWKLLVGEIPSGTELDHLCRVRNCVNPDHLEPVIHVENLRRGYGFGSRNAAKTVCPQGHPYDVVTTAKDGRRARSCSTCRPPAKRPRRKTAMTESEKRSLYVNMKLGLLRSNVKV